MLTGAATSAQEPPAIEYKASAIPINLPAPRMVYIPSSVDRDPAHTAHSVVVPPGTDPVPEAPIGEPAHAHQRKTDKEPAWACIDKTECYFTGMPLYNQINPNLAYVDIPLPMFNAEKKPASGAVQWDKEAHHWAVVLTSGVKKVLDPFYASLLPYGPAAGDAGSIDHWFTALCGPTAGSMVIMAAIEAKGPNVKVKAGSWTEASFLDARKPDWEMPISRH